MLITEKWLRSKGVLGGVIKEFVGIFGKKAKVKDVVVYLLRHDHYWQGNMLGTDFELAKEMIKHGANIHAGEDVAISEASGRGEIELVEFLLSKGLDIHVNQEAPLLAAIELGKLPMVKYLLAKGANIRGGYMSALECASFYGHMDILKCLLKTNQYSQKELEQAFIVAADGDQLKVLKYLAPKIDINSETDCGETVGEMALMQAELRADDTPEGETGVIKYLRKLSGKEEKNF